MELLEEGLLSFQCSAVPDLRGGCSTLPVFSRRGDDSPCGPLLHPNACRLCPLPSASCFFSLHGWFYSIRADCCSSHLEKCFLFCLEETQTNQRRQPCWTVFRLPVVTPFLCCFCRKLCQSPIPPFFLVVILVSPVTSSTPPTSHILLPPH